MLDPLTEDQLRCLIAFKLAKGRDRDQDEFADGLAQAFVVSLGNTGKRDLLVEVLSGEFPRATVFYWTEFYVVFYDADKINRPILVFVEAYRLSKSEKVKQGLAEALRHAFSGLVSQNAGVSDDTFVQICSEWYLKNERRCVVNEEYSLNCKFYEGFKVPLFIVKP